MYLSNLLINRSPRTFARVPVLIRVNDSDTFILTSGQSEIQQQFDAFDFERMSGY